ncbi:MAG: helix-turn-helix transcriptional regulator [Bacilli bacterium]|nr:helix-turn-helix transcriptional regulator [Bacilli bacterium]
MEHCYRIAKRCNVPQSTIGRIENFTMTPSLDLILSILNALDIEIELNKKKKQLINF